MQEAPMPEVTIVYWRDIPAQIIVGSGRGATKRPLPERFEQAIDRCAMKVGARDADSYLGEWRKGEPYSVEGEAADVASDEAARLETVFGPDAIKALIANDGWADPKP
jgi:Virulence factor